MAHLIGIISNFILGQGRSDCDPDSFLSFPVAAGLDIFAVQF